MGKTLIPFLLFLTLNCSCVKQTSPTTADTLPDEVKSIAVLPVAFFQEGTDSPQKIKELESGVNALSQSINEYFTGNDKVQIVSSDEIESLSTNYSSTPYAESLHIGKSIHVEAVMTLVLEKFNERKGTDYAVTSPASVSFDYRLIHTESGKTLCSGSFSETQQAATENILSLKKLSGRGFKWISAYALTREGVFSTLSGCKYLK